MDGMIPHWGMVRRIDAERATVVVETTACGACGHVGHCGIGKAAAGKLAAWLNLPTVNGLKEGDFVHVGLPAAGLTLAAVLGYLFPALATLAGTVAGALVGHSDGSMALGAAAGFAASLVAARIALAWTPGLSPAPRILPHDSLSSPFPQEQHHD